MANGRRATRSMFLNRGTTRLLTSALASRRANEWIMARCVPRNGIRQAVGAGATAPRGTR
jgi:hypothetical protein